MIPFELVEPESLGEAISLLDPEDATVRPIAGGTALMLMMKAGVFRPTRLVSLRKLAAHNSRIAIGKDGALTIGAMTPLALVERSPDVARAAPVIPFACATLRPSAAISRTAIRTRTCRRSLLRCAPRSR